MMNRELILGTRGSALALTQSQQVADKLTGLTGVPVKLKIIQTRGDRIQNQALSKVGGKGLFTAELETGLRDGHIDLAVHSLKDLPTEDVDGLAIGAFPEREDSRDALVGGNWASLDEGARVGTGSLRRGFQLRSLRPDLEIVDIRGNVDTRLAKLDDGQFDAIVLAMAGLKRLGVQRDDVTALKLDQMLPAVGQGALAVQIRRDDPAVTGLVRQLDHAPTRRCVEAERSFLKNYGGGCNVPVACHATLRNQELRLVVVGPDNVGRLVRLQCDGPDGVGMGREMAKRLQDSPSQ